MKKIFSFFMIFLLFFSIFGIDTSFARPVEVDDPGSISYTSGYEATAYAPSAGGINCSGDCSVGAAGTKVKSQRSIAVDTKDIPLGSVVALKFPNAPQFNGLYLAEDTGGAIKGKRIDVLLEPESLANTFGRQDAQIVILEVGSGAKDAQEKVKNWDEIVAKYPSVETGEGWVANDEEKEDGKKSGSKNLVGEYGYVSPFKDLSPDISNVGVDERINVSSKINEYGVYSFGSKIGLFLFRSAQIASVFIIGILCIYWLVAALAYSGLFFANEWLNKMTFGKVDVLTPGGFSTLGKYSAFAFVVIAVIITGTTPKIFALIYSMLADFTEFISRISFI